VLLLLTQTGAAIVEAAAVRLTQVLDTLRRDGGLIEVDSGDLDVQTAFALTDPTVPNLWIGCSAHAGSRCPPTDFRR
jgi:hypothetical protein